MIGRLTWLRPAIGLPRRLAAQAAQAGPMRRAGIARGGFTDRTVLPLPRQMRRLTVVFPIVSGKVVRSFTSVPVHCRCVQLLLMTEFPSMSVIVREMGCRVASMRRNHRRAQVFPAKEDFPTPVAVSIKEPATSATRFSDPDIRVAADVDDVMIACGLDIEVVALGHQRFAHDGRSRHDRRTGRRWRRGHHNAGVGGLRGDPARRSGHASSQHERARDSGDGEDQPHIVQAMLHLTVAMILG